MKTIKNTSPSIYLVRTVMLVHFMCNTLVQVCGHLTIAIQTIARMLYANIYLRVQCTFDYIPVFITSCDWSTKI